MSDTSNIAELGRNKGSYTPAEHLEHLLNLGWSPNSPLIKKYVINNGLKRLLDEWKKTGEQEISPQK